MKFFFTLLTILVFASPVFTQNSRHIIRFANKGTSSFSLQAPLSYLSQKSINRRTRQKIQTDSTDLPVNPAYIDSLKNVPNVVVISNSKWLNQVLIRTSDSAALTRIRQFPFVKFAMAIALKAKPQETIIQKQFTESVVELPERPLLNSRQRETKVLDTIAYGNTYAQIHIHEGEYLHNRGFTGQGMTIAILDAGFFGYKTNPALDSLRLQNRVLGEYDFVNNETSVNEDHPHGFQCLSIIASNRPGILVGSAPNASFYLFRTEDAATEYPVEEHNWVVAAEYADSAGVDLISSSLGYADFDDPAFNHEYIERNGNTSMITIGADLAAKKGIIVMNSAGNSGNFLTDFKYISCPADGDSVMAVGAVDANGMIASFSSWGPNSAGKIKPDIVSVGQGTILATNSGTPAAGNGTSYSNPNAAGLITCLWQAFPEFTNMEIIDAVKRSSDKYMMPDVRYGYGLPNFRVAYDLLSKERTLRNSIVILGNEWIKAFPVPFRNQLNILFKSSTTGKGILQLITSSGMIVETIPFNAITGQHVIARFSSAPFLSKGVYFIRYQAQGIKYTLKAIRN